MITPWWQPRSLRGAHIQENDKPCVTHKNSENKKNRQGNYLWLMQENTIVLGAIGKNTIWLGATEFECLGGTRVRSLATATVKRGNFIWTELAGETTKIRRKLLCSRSGIYNSDIHRVQSTDIDLIFGWMLKDRAVYNVYIEKRASCGTVISVLEHSARCWQTGVAHYMSWWRMYCSCWMCPESGHFFNDSSHHYLFCCC